MPTLSSMIIPAPRDWDEFEKISLSCLQIKWQTSDLTRNGRQGQKQDGVDIYGTDDLGRHVGVQCKKTEKDISIATIEDAIDIAEKFEPELDSFYIATTAPNDSKIQRSIRRLSRERVNAKKFPVGIFFWDDLIQELLKNEPEFKKHFPQISLGSNRSNEKPRFLCLLDIAFFGLTIKFYLNLLFGDVGLIAGEDPRQILTITDIVNSCSMVLFESETSEKISELTRIVDSSLSIISGEKVIEGGWNIVNDSAVDIVRLISNLQYSLVGKELAVFNIGRLIGNWDVLITRDDVVSQEQQNEVIETIRVISADKSAPEEIVNMIQKYNENNQSAVHLHMPYKIYSSIKRILLFQEMREK